MLDIAFELIGEATSNSLLMFCFCNLIIVIILTGSSKPGSMDSQDYTVTTSVSFNTCHLASHDHDCVGDDDDDDEEMIVVDVSSCAQDESLTDASTISDEYEDKETSHYCGDDEDEDEDEEEEEENEDDEDDEDENTEADVEEEEEDDDLRKRAEEFIAKVNNEWRHEKLRALNLVC